MQAFLCDDVTVETFISLPTTQRNSRLRPLLSPDLPNLFKTLTAFILHDSTDVAAKTRNILRELLGDSPTPLSEVLTPKLVVATFVGSYGCHYRISDSVSDIIFINRWLWMQWRDALSSQSQDLDGLQVMLVATLLHELAHRCISLAVGTVDRDLVFLETTNNLTPEETQNLEKNRDDEVTSKVTPERLRVPWLSAQGEAGLYIEWKIFGGIIGWDIQRRQAFINVGPSDIRVLTESMVRRGAQELLLDYVEEFGLLGTVSPSPSTTTMAPILKSFGHNPDVDAGLITACNGVKWPVISARPIQADVNRLRHMANAMEAGRRDSGLVEF